MLMKNVAGTRVTADGKLEHIPMTCSSCLIPESAVYGAPDGTWFCVGCWQKVAYWKFLHHSQPQFFGIIS